MNLGMTELIIILVIVLVIFGPSKLPGLGKAMGETIRGFKKGMTDSIAEPAEKSAPMPPERTAQIATDSTHSTAGAEEAAKQSVNQKEKA